MLNLWFFYINIIKWNIWLFKIICNIIRTKMINLRLLWIICNNLISQNSCMNFFWTCFAFFLLLCNIFSFCISWFIKKLWDIALAYAVTDLMRIIEVNVSLFPFNAYSFWRQLIDKAWSIWISLFSSFKANHPSPK